MKDFGVGSNIPYESMTFSQKWSFLHLISVAFVKLVPGLTWNSKITSLFMVTQVWSGFKATEKREMFAIFGWNSNFYGN